MKLRLLKLNLYISTSGCERQFPCTTHPSFDMLFIFLYMFLKMCALY